MTNPLVWSDDRYEVEDDYDRAMDSVNAYVPYYEGEEEQYEQNTF